MNFAAFKEAVIRAAAEMGIADYELYYQTSESTSVSAFQHELNEFTSSMEGGLCLRCIVGGKMGYASTEDLNPEKAKDLLARAADNAATIENEDAVFLGEGGQTYEPLELKPYDLPATDALIATVLDTQEKLYAADETVVDGSTTRGIAERSEFAIFNSRGLDLRYTNNLAALVVAAVVEKDEEKSDDYQIKLGDLATMDAAALTKKAAATAIGKLGGEVAPTGNYPVVFDPDAMSSLLSVFSSVFSSEAAHKGLSKLAGKEGEAIAAPIVTLVDDPFHPENPTPINFDAEGSPTHRKNVIENGVLTTLLYNLKAAARAGKATTGNASKAGYDAPVGIRPFSMYLAGGDLTEDELIAKADNGIFINSLEGLHAGANPISGDFSLQAAGFMIENGKKTTHVKSFTVAGNFYDLLKNITALANNCHLPNAMGMTAFGSPSVLVEGLSIAGK
ncbi:MAG: TldD/PmbA family protein [Oscillospiraceae bacterium]|nr:TldD/PmbA family protein [Oscillospiraceae bacterium]